MIIVGDIASPNKKLTKNLAKVFNQNSQIFSDQTLIFNLEGLITDSSPTETETPVLFSHSSLLKTIKKSSENAIALLANNHTLDLPQFFDSTTQKLDEQEILFTGAGKSWENAEAPVRFYEDGHEVYLFNYCWDFLLYHQNNPSDNIYLSEIREKDIIDKIAKYKSNNPQASIIVCFHWSIDLETLPYPMYRQFARALVDNGANVVAGCHSHCVQGGETYKDGYIIYGLGNFYIPWYVYANGKLAFTDFAKKSVALDWDPITNTAKCHWFEYDEKQQLVNYIKTELFEESKLLLEYSPFVDMKDSEYLDFFRKNRRKKFFIPIYTDYKKVLYNKWLNFLIKTRAKTARALAKLNLIKWQN